MQQSVRLLRLLTQGLFKTLLVLGLVNVRQGWHCWYNNISHCWYNNISHCWYNNIIHCWYNNISHCWYNNISHCWYFHR